MSAHSASSIDIVTRVWVNSADYWTVNFDIIEAVKREFDANGIEIPFNQLDVHVKND
jgi:small conductance mechanosensitive channel